MVEAEVHYANTNYIKIEAGCHYSFGSRPASKAHHWILVTLRLGAISTNMLKHAIVTLVIAVYCMSVHM